MATQDKGVKSVTIGNLEAAFAGEAMAHIKYRYFAKLARAAGAEDVAKVFEETADQEVMHAFGHLDLLYPKAQMTPAKALEIAIEAKSTSTPKCTRSSAIWPSRKATAPPSPNSTSRSKSRKSMPPPSSARWKPPPNASLRWPTWKSATPTTTRPRWPS